MIRYMQVKDLREDLANYRDDQILMEVPYGSTDPIPLTWQLYHKQHVLNLGALPVSVGIIALQIQRTYQPPTHAFYSLDVRHDTMEVFNTSDKEQGSYSEMSALAFDLIATIELPSRTCMIEDALGRHVVFRIDRNWDAERNYSWHTEVIVRPLHQGDMEDVNND